MKRLAKICTFLILIICGVAFAACGESGKTPVLTPSVSNVDLVIGTDESKSFDVVLSDYANGNDGVVVESYEENVIISIETKKIADGKTRVTLTPLYPGKATVKISSQSHSAKPVEVSVNVILPVGRIDIDGAVKESLYIIKGQQIDFEKLGVINYFPIETANPNLENAKTNQEGVVYSLDSETSGLTLENGILSVASDCTLSEVSIRAVSIFNEEISQTFKVKILNPIQSSLSVDGKVIYRNGNLQDSANSAFELFPRESDITISSKKIIFEVVAGSEDDLIKVEKIFDETKFSVELESLIFEKDTHKYTYTYVVTALNSGYLDNISFNVGYRDYTFADKGEDYFVSSGNLTFASYNQPNAVLVNGNSSGEKGVNIVVFENVVSLNKAAVLEFTLSPAHLPADCNTIRLFASKVEIENLPVNFYKMNSTRTGYELVLGCDKNGGEDKNGNYYYDMPVGTKLYIIKNDKFNSENANATIFACELNDYNANGDRTKLQMNIKVNPGASAVDRAEITNNGFNVIENANSIITEFKETEIYLAISPSNFDIGTTSVAKLKNSTLAEISEFTVVSKDDNYVYVKFTIKPKKLGSTKLTVYLCDGFERGFDLKIISSLEDIDVFINSTEKENLDYNAKVEEADGGRVIEKLAFKNGVTIKLDKFASPQTAEYTLEYKFYDLSTTALISSLTFADILGGVSDEMFKEKSAIVNANILNTYGVIQSLTNQSEGKTLIRVGVKGRLQNGSYEETASHTFYFLVEIYKGIDGFEISKNTHEVYSFETLGNYGNNAEKSITTFTIDISSKLGTPTYLNALELYYGNNNSPIEFGTNNRCENIEGLTISRELKGTSWEFTVQALTSELQNHIFIAKLVEVDKTKVLGGVVRIIVKEAVEIDNIEIVNVDLKDGIYVENNLGEEPVNFEILYNIYTKNSKEPLNSGLIFELSQSLKDLGVEIDNNGLLTIPAKVGIGGDDAFVLIYPQSNYFNGLNNSEIPFVELKITIANGQSEETAVRINTQDKISYLKDYPTKHYILVADLSITETVEDFSGGLYGDYQGKTMTLNVFNGAIFDKLTGTVKNLNIVGEVNASGLNASGLLANINGGTIENVNVLAGAKITSNDGYVGGLVGENLGTISGGEIEAIVSGVNVGGVAGKNSAGGSINLIDEKGVTFAGNITASGNAGAIACENAGTISGAKVERWSNNSVAIINSTKTGYVGGIVAVNSGTVEKCYAASYNKKTSDIISASGFIGGIVGQNTGSVDQCMTNLSLEGANIGAVVYETTGEVSNVYTLSEVSSSSALAFAASGVSNITNAYSMAYYIEGETKKYLTAQAAGANRYCATSATFESDVQTLVDNTVWKSENGGLPYLVNADPPKPVDNINIDINESTDEFLGDETNLNLVLYYYQLINQIDDENVKSELNNKNSIDLIDIFGENAFIFENLSSNSLKIVGGKLSVLGVGKTTLKVTSKYATPDCQAKEITLYAIYPIQDFNIYRGASSQNPSNIVSNGILEGVELSGSKLYNSNVKSTVLLAGANYSIYTNLYAVGFNVEVDADEVIVGVNSIYNNAGNGTFDDDYTFIAEGTFKVYPTNKIDAFKDIESPELLLSSILTIQNDVGNYLGNIKEISDFDAINALISAKFNKNFKIKVIRGATRIQSTLTEAELTPSNVLTFEVELTTDELSVNDSNLKVEIVDKASGKIVSDISKEDAVFVCSASVLNETNPYLYKVIISVDDDAKKVAEFKEYVIEIYSADRKEKVSLSIDLTLVPQEVENVSYSHYAAITGDDGAFTTEVIPTTVLKPGKNGVLALNLYPSFASYKKIEIESAVIGENYVLFEQMIYDNNSYKSASGTIGYSSEKDTKKLTIHYSDKLAEDNGMVYIRTKIIESVGDGVSFPITIRVFPKNAEKDVKTESLVLTSETIDKAQILINGEKEAVVARGKTVEFQIAVREDQELNAVNIINYVRDINDPHDYIHTVFNLSDYTIENGKKIYTGSLVVGLNAAFNKDPDHVVEIRTVMNRWINGSLEQAFDTAKVRIVDFTVDGIYIEGNDVEDNVFVAPIQIEQKLTFGFILSEIPTTSASSASRIIERIKDGQNTFLETLSYESEKGGYVINGGVGDYYKNIAYNMYYLSSNTKLFNEYGEYRANNNFELKVEKLANGNPALSREVLINGLRSGNVPMQIKIGYKLPGLADEKYITYDFVVKVQIYEDEDFPITINNEEEFLQYMNATSTESGDPANYILMNDIYLKDFTPIPNTDLIASLDGNNKVITIKNFNIEGMLSNNENQSLNLALFQYINEGTTLKNLTVNLFELEDIIIDENLVNNVNVAGLFIDNYGAIYNCEVVAINMAYLKEQLSTKVYNFESILSGLNQGYTATKYTNGNGIRVYFDGENLNKLKSDNTTVRIAGLGLTNHSAGRITNSRVGGQEFKKVVFDYNTNQNIEHTISTEHISIYGQADIAGFVMENNGLIASSFFSNGNIKNVAVSGTASRTAGFVAYNNFSAQILGSYAVGYKKLSEQNSKFYTDGGIYSEGIAAAFVYQNASIISDSYANMLMGGKLSGRIVSGFVYHNEISGEIERCYSASTITGELTTRMPFSGNNAKGESMQLGNLSNCYYFVKNYETESLLEEKYSTGAYAVSTTTIDDDLLYGMSFTSGSTSHNGSNYDGVWEWNGDITLTSANDIAISVRYLIENYNGVNGVKRLPYVSKYAYGSENNPIIIRTADEFNRVFGQETNLKENAFYAISQYYNKNKGIAFGHYRLISHIDFNELEIVETNKIASSVMTLTTYGDGKIGVFDGNGLKISNIEIALNNSSVGLFSQVVKGSIVKNAELTVKQITSGIGVYVGGVAGYLSNASIVNIDIQATTQKGDNRSEINGVNVVGGIVGIATGTSKLSNVSSAISVISSYRGQNEYERTQSDISRVSYAGGIVGVLDIYKNAGDGSVTPSKPQVNKFKVYGQAIIIKGYYVGGVIGYLGRGTYAADLLFEITGGVSSTFEQKISSTGTTIGGIIGVNYGDISEARIEHEEVTQTAIEEAVGKNYTGSASRGGHSNLFVFEDATNADNEGTSEVAIKYAGGLIGQMKNGNIENSYSKVDVVADCEYAGGIIGKNESNGKLFEVYAFGDVDGEVAGGIIGLNLGQMTLEHVVAINYYSKNNSHIVCALDVVNKINNLVKTTGTLEYNNYYSELLMEYEYDSDLDIIFTFTTTEKEDSYSIQVKDLLEDRTVQIAKVENEYFVYHNGEWNAFTENNDTNKNYDKFFEAVDGTTKIYQEGGKVYTGYDTEKHKVQNEITFEEDTITTYYLSDIKVEDEEVVFEAEKIENTKITELNLYKLGCIVGEDDNRVGKINISKEVFANKDLSLNGIKLHLALNVDENGEYKVKDLTKSLEEYEGAAKHGIEINRMFLSASDGWDPQVWGKNNDDMLPYLTFGVLSKILYIEKPEDFLRLWKYSGQDNLVVIGDDPSTVFNPYRYIPGDERTYGEFDELNGLEIDENGNLHFDLSGINSAFVPKDFYGTLHGEMSGKKYFISGLDKPLFDNVSGAVIRNIGFEGNGSTALKTALMANKITGSTIENITVQSSTISITGTNGIAGALALEIDTEELKNITISNVTLNVSGGNNTMELFAGMLAGKININKLEEIKVSDCSLNINSENDDSTFKSVNAGMIAGYIGVKNIETQSDIKFNNCFIRGNSNALLEINVNVDVLEHARLGGFAGNVDGNAKLESNSSVDVVKDLTINFSAVETGKVYAGLMFGVLGDSFGIDAQDVNYKLNVTGTITNTTNETTNYYVVGKIGGLAGRTSGQISNITINANINVKVKTLTLKSSSISAVGGLIGEQNGGDAITLSEININTTENDPEIGIRVNNSCADRDPIAVGGVIGLTQNNFTTEATLTVGGAINVVSGAKSNRVGGIIGLAQNAIINIEKNSTSTTNITASGDQVYAGGIVGEISGGSLSGTYNGNIVINIVINNDGSDASLSVGGIAGFAKDATIENAIVSGNIQIETSATEIRVSDIYIGGVVGKVAGGSVLSTKSWGNIMLKDNIQVTKLYIGGIVGFASEYWEFAGNKTLTSIYNKVLASENKLNNVRALVGHTDNTPETEVYDEEHNQLENNQYSHMVNLAVDNTDLGENVAYSDLSKNFEGTGSKLNPTAINEDTTNTIFGDSEIANVNAWEIVYYQADGDVSFSDITSDITIEVNAHLIGNGKTWSANTTPIDTNNGYVSGFKFEIKKPEDSDFVDGTSGIAGTNSGVIYANSVVIYGNITKDGNISFSEADKAGAINSGVAGINSDSGLIMDTGALLYVNNATAGFVASNSGTILNSYVNGVVHNGAASSFNAGNGKVINCYTTVRSAGAIFSGTTIDDCFYDKFGTEKTQTKPGVNELTTNGSNGTVGMAAVNDGDGNSTTTGIVTGEDENGNEIESLNSNLKIFAQNYTINFGYPTLMGAGYSSQNASYMKLGTGNSTNASLLQIPNVGKLEQIENLYIQDKIRNKTYAFNLITDLDYKASELSSHYSATIDSAIFWFAGNNYKINNIPGGSNGFFEKISIVIGTVSNVEFNYDVAGAEISDQTTNSTVGGVVDFAEVKDPENILNILVFENVRSSGATVSGTGNVGGLVGYATNVNFVNVRSSGATISGTGNVGGLVGIMRGGSMENCFNFNNVVASGTDTYYVGGLVGCATGVTFGGENTADRVGNYGNVSATNSSKSDVGGLVGYMNNGSMKNAFNFNNVVTSGTGTYNVGGLVGYATGVIFGGGNTADRVGNYGNVSADNSSKSDVGGLVGYMNGGSMKNAFNFNNVVASGTGTYNVGGLVGYARGVAFGGENTAYRVGNYGNVSATNTAEKSAFTGQIYAGGIVGKMIGGLIKYAFNIGNIHSETKGYFAFSQAYSGGIAGRIERSYTEKVYYNYLYNYGQIVSSNYAGGIVGACLSDLQYAFNYNTVLAQGGGGAVAGGIAATLAGELREGKFVAYIIENSGNEADVSAVGEGWCAAGGIVGSGSDPERDSGCIYSCYNTANVYVKSSGEGYAGGIAGANIGSIIGCSMTGTIKVYDFDINNTFRSFGWIMGSTCNTDNATSIKGCYVEPSTVQVETGSVDCTSGFLHRDQSLVVTAVLILLGHAVDENPLNPANFTNNYAYFAGEQTVGSLSFAAGYYSFSRSTDGWTALYNSCQASGYVAKSSNGDFSAEGDAELSTDCLGKGVENTIEQYKHKLDWANQVVEDDRPTTDEDGITHITTAEELAYVSQNIANNYANADIELDADIDLTGYIWTPIGDETTPFSGTFNGNDKTITGMAAFDEDAAGLFGSVYKESGTQTFEDVIFKNCVSQSWRSAGILAGQIEGEQDLEISEIYLENTYSCGKAGMVNNCMFAKIVSYDVMFSYYPENRFGLSLTITATETGYSYMLLKNLNLLSPIASEADISSIYFAGGKTFKVDGNLYVKITIADFSEAWPEATFEYIYN